MKTYLTLFCAYLLIYSNQYCQTKWKFQTKGFTVYSDLLSFSQERNFVKSDPHSGNYSFGIQYNFQLYSDKLHYTPGLNISYLGVGGIVKSGSDITKPYQGIPIQVELLTCNFNPISFETKIISPISMYFNSGISLWGKDHLMSQKLGSILDGEDIFIYNINCGIKVKMYSNLYGMIAGRYYFGDQYNFNSYFSNENVSQTKINIFNFGIGLSYNLFTTETKNEVRLGSELDSLNNIIRQKNLALEELKSSMNRKEKELAEYKNKLLLPSDTSKLVEQKNNSIIVNIDSLNQEYNAKFYSNISIEEFLTRNHQYLSEDGKALIEGYYDVANKIEINKTKGIYLLILISEKYWQIFSHFINNLNLGNTIILEKSNIKSDLRIEFDLKKIKSMKNIGIEIRSR
jgi:hypothetical protein